MKKTLVILCVLGLAAAVGYLLGTEQGRARRDQVLTKVKNSGGSFDDTADPLVTDISDATANGVSQAEVASI